MKNACYRWGCEFVEVTQNHVGDQDLCFNKLVVIERFNDDERVFYVDADVLIRNDSPSPFVLFPDASKVYAGRDVHPSYDLPRYMEVIDPWLQNTHNNFHLVDDFTALYESRLRWFFNAGLFLCSPGGVRPEIDLFVRNIPPFPVSGRNEQAMWNYILKCKDKVELIGYEWNTINPDISSGKMGSYVYHMTGFDWKPYRDALPTYSWKV